MPMQEEEEIGIHALQRVHHYRSNGTRSKNIENDENQTQGTAKMGQQNEQCAARCIIFMFGLSPKHAEKHVMFRYDAPTDSWKTHGHFGVIG